MSDYITVNEAADMLRKHPVTIRIKAERGELPGNKIFGRWLFVRSKIKAIAEGK